MPIPHLLTPNSVVVVIDNKPYTVDKSHKKYKKILKAIKKGASEEKILGLIDNTLLKKKLELLLTTSEGILQIQGSTVHCTIQNYEFPLNDVMTKAVLAIAENDMPLQPVMNFLTRLSKNGDPEVIDQLLGFIEANGFTIRDDGKFEAYKKVTNEYKDIYTRTMNNSIGAIVEMPRHAVQKDINVTCSKGLHACAWSYLRSFGGSHQNGSSRVVIVAIDPADVVSIPVDYHNAKLRCCKYVVDRELVLDEELRKQFAIYDREEEEDVEEDLEDYAYEW